jgi:O-antigen/teichoic acid export membrane protein
LILESFRFLFLPIATEYYEAGELDDLRAFYTVSSKWIAAGTLPLVLVFGLFADQAVTSFFDRSMSQRLLRYPFSSWGSISAHW